MGCGIFLRKCLTRALCFFPAYKTVSGVNGPLVILDQVKVNTQLLMKFFEGQLAGKAGKGKTQTAGKFH